MRLRLSFSFLLFLVLLPFSAASGQSTSSASATIRGTVYDPDHRPVPGAHIALLDSMISIAETESGSAGEYQFLELRGGTFTIVANLPGFTSFHTDIELQSGATVTEDIYLQLSAVQDEVVVSASLGGALAPETGSSVTVVSQNEIASQGFVTLADSLRNVPGVAINRTGQLGAVTSAFIRGGNSNYNLILIDGIPMNDFGGGFDLAPLPVDGVSEVEVLRGTESALFGSNAVSGVINVITTAGEGPPQFSFVGEGGSYHFYRLATGGEGLFHGFSWAYDLARLDTQGPVIDDNYRNQTSFVSLGYSRSPRRKFIAHFFGDAGREENPGPWGSDPDDLFAGIPASFTKQVQDLFGYQASETEQFSSWFQQVSTVSVATDHYFFPATPATFGSSSFTKNLRLTANTRSEMTLSPKDVLVAGFEYDREEWKDTFVTNAAGAPFLLPRNTYAFFAENRWDASNRVFLSTGVRVDVIQTDALPSIPIPATTVAQADPRLSVAYLARQSSGDRIGMTRIHSSFGTGIRPPDGFELGFTNNPNLKPERSISVDAGVEQRFFDDKAVFDVTYFYNAYRDQIVSIGGPLGTLSPYLSANLARSRADGIETSMRLHPLRSLEIMGEYTWLNSAILSVANAPGVVQVPFTVGQPLLRRPRSSAGYNITWTHGPLMLNSNASIRGAVLDIEPNDGAYACSISNGDGGFLPCLFRNSGYVDANLGMAYRLPWKVEIFGHLNNFLNERYEESFGFPALRLNFVAGVKFHFSGDHSSR
ncbi:MAG TPA: TonB-dependent receptor [Candidatus Acidoferrum sp.]|nr:TonB-dependent receptor [Candidatus Acidoferrum sp.]